MAKNLFRVNFTNPENDKDRVASEKTESFKVSDDTLSRYLDVHVLKVSFPSINPKKREELISIWGRDNITEWGDVLYVKPGLKSKGSKKSPFEKMMRKLGYEKHIEPQFPLSDGGLYVFGNQFILISDIFESKFSKKFESIMKYTRLDKPFYFVPSLTSREAGHIDCDYQIIDQLKLIYGSDNVFCKSKNDEFVKARKRLEKIASEHNFDVREYRSCEEEAPDGVIEDWDGEIARKFNGINSIVYGGNFLTGSIHPEEREYLHERRLDAVAVPLGKVNAGAGLRCVYGEFNL